MDPDYKSEAYRAQIAAARLWINDANDEPTGIHTGRCPWCGSRNLWDDNLSTGCNEANCGWVYIGNQ